MVYDPHPDQPAPPCPAGRAQAPPQQPTALPGYACPAPIPPPPKRELGTGAILAIVFGGLLAICVCIGALGAAITGGHDKDPASSGGGAAFVAPTIHESEPTTAAPTTDAPPTTEPSAPPPAPQVTTTTAPGPTATSRQPTPPRTSSQPPRDNCHPAYPTVCIPPPPPDLNCNDIPYRRFRVLAPDPHKFDANKDGVGCESLVGADESNTVPG